MPTATTTRPLTADERARFSAARLHALGWQPYLASALFRVTPVAAPGLGTMAVDPGWRLYVDPTVFDTWGPEASGAVLLHEANHLVRDHAARAAAHGVTSRSEHEAWNYAGDAEANDDLLAAAVPLPDGCVTPAALGQPDGQTAEVYYDTLRPPTDQEPSGGAQEPSEGDVGCGSGAGAASGGWELAPGDPTAPAMTPAEADLVRRKVALDVTEATAKARGSVPAGMTRWAAGTLRPPVVPWRRVLAGAVRSALRARAGTVDYSYARPARRRVPGVVLPALRQPVPTVAVVVDTSGSMSEADLAAAMAEVKGICTRVGVRGEALQLLAVDAHCAAPQAVTRVESIRLSGGGGTDMRVGIAAAEALSPRPDAVVVLSDGWTPWPSERTRARLVTGIIGPAEAIAAAREAFPPPPWATVVNITD